MKLVFRMICLSIIFSISGCHIAKDLGKNMKTELLYSLLIRDQDFSVFCNAEIADVSFCKSDIGIVYTLNSNSSYRSVQRDYIGNPLYCSNEVTFGMEFLKNTKEGWIDMLDTLCENLKLEDRSENLNWRHHNCDDFPNIILKYSHSPVGAGTPKHVEIYTEHFISKIELVEYACEVKLYDPILDFISNHILFVSGQDTLSSSITYLIYDGDDNDENFCK